VSLQIILVRHGEDTDNARQIVNGHRQTSLTPRGRKQAQEAAQKLKKEKIDAFYSSPLKRAKETAKIIEKIIIKPPFKIQPLLIERDFGLLTGKKNTLISQYASHFLISPFGGTFFWGIKKEESFSDLMERAQKLIFLLKKEHSHQKILLVGHMEINLMIEAVLNEETSWRRALKRFRPMKNGEVRRFTQAFE